MLERNVLFSPIGSNAPCGLWRQSEKRANRCAGLAARPQLQYLTEEHQGHDDGSSLEIRSDAAGVVAKRRWERVGCEYRDEAVAKCHADTKCDEREHVRAAMDDRLPATHEEWPSAPQHDRCGKGELNPAHQSCRNQAVNGLSRQYGTEHRHEQWCRQRRRHQEPPAHVDEFRVLFLIEGDRARFERHAADRTAPGAVADDLRVHRANPLSLLNRGDGFERLERHATLRAGAWSVLPHFRMHRTGMDRVLPGRRGHGLLGPI